MRTLQKGNWWLPGRVPEWVTDMLICQLRYWRLYSAFLRDTHGESLKSDIQYQGPRAPGEFSVDSHAEEEASWVDSLCVVHSLCGTRRLPRNHFTDPLSFSLQRHACLPPSSLQGVTSRSSLNMSVSLIYSVSTRPYFYFFWQFHSLRSLWAPLCYNRKQNPVNTFPTSKALISHHLPC